MSDSSKTGQFTVVSFYKFVPTVDPGRLRDSLHSLCMAEGIRGTVLLAEEGINGTLAGSRAAIDAVMAFLRADPRFADIEFKLSVTHELPFFRLKVRIKNEIVTMGVPDTDPSYTTGTRVDAQQWNELLEDPEVLVIDTRNDYESRVGSFTNAVPVNTRSFAEFPLYVKQNLDPDRHNRIAIFCTGGIRCEKASAYLLQQGFNEVYQLHGGILNYLESVPAAENRWQGECFVFDGRVAVDLTLQPGEYVQCHACRQPVSPEQQQSGQYEEGISCPHCHDNLTERKRKGLKERQRQVQLARTRNTQHIGVPQPGKPA